MRSEYVTAMVALMVGYPLGRTQSPLEERNESQSGRERREERGGKGRGERMCRGVIDMSFISYEIGRAGAQVDDAVREAQRTILKAQYPGYDDSWKKFSDTPVQMSVSTPQMPTEIVLVDTPGAP